MSSSRCARLCPPRKTKLREAEMTNFVSGVLWQRFWENIWLYYSADWIRLQYKSFNRYKIKKKKIFFLDCASHRFQLTIRKVISIVQETASKVQTLSVKLRHLLQCAKQQRHTKLHTKLGDDTRWISVCVMPKQINKLREHLASTKIDELDKLLLSPARERRFELLLTKLEELSKVVLRL